MSKLARTAETRDPLVNTPIKWILITVGALTTA
jgi:hypothetical protein